MKEQFHMSEPSQKDESSAADPHHFHADPTFQFRAEPDPTFQFDTDPTFQFAPDPTFHIDADPDPTPRQFSQICDHWHKDCEHPRASPPWRHFEPS